MNQETINISPLQEAEPELLIESPSKRQRTLLNTITTDHMSFIPTPVDNVKLEIDPTTQVPKQSINSVDIENQQTVNIHEDEILNFKVITNDDTDSSCRYLIILKNIFSKQLPKMPKEYIVRLVLDRRHVTLALLKGKKIIGGVCYRPYFEQKFAEIAFLAISANEQVLTSLITSLHFYNSIYIILCLI